MTLPLPEFLDQLQQQNNMDIDSHQTLVDQCTQLYTLARYGDGVRLCLVCMSCLSVCLCICPFSISLPLCLTIVDLFWTCHSVCWRG